MKIRAAIKEVGKQLEAREIENDYKEIQNIVGGLFTILLLPNDNTVDVYCNDEGLLLGLDPNVMLYEYKTGVVGPLMFAGYNDEGETISLTDEQIKHIEEYVNRNGVDYYG